MIEAGAAGVHFEDQLSSEKKCGHLGGKVLIPTAHFVRSLVAARLAADVLDVPTVLIARTDALSAGLLTSDIDERDRAFCTGERTPEGFFRVKDGIDAAIARGLAYAPYADMLWVETSTPDLEEAKAFADAIHARFPNKLLAYNWCGRSLTFSFSSSPFPVLLLSRHPRPTPSLQLALLQLAAPPGRRDDRHLPGGAGADGVRLPVCHAGRLPLAQPRHV